jgi:hypothetical protein
MRDSHALSNRVNFKSLFCRIKFPERETSSGRTERRFCGSIPEQRFLGLVARYAPASGTGAWIDMREIGGAIGRIRDATIRGQTRRNRCTGIG